MRIHRRAFLALCTTAPASRLLSAEPELRVAVNRTTIESAPLLVQPIPGVRIVPVANGREASAQLVSGMADAATGSETQLLLNSVAQPDLRAVLTLAECRYRMVARRSAGISRTADLRGKRVAATPGTSSVYFLESILTAAGLRLSDVTAVVMEGSAMPGTLAAREIDAMAMWEPHAQNAIDRLGADAVALQDRDGYIERFNLNTTVAVLADPEKRRLLGELVRGVRRVSNELDGRRHIVTLSAAIATPAPVIERAWAQFRFPASLDETGLLRLMERVEQWAAATARREPRSRSALARLIDPAVQAESRSGR